MAVVNRKSTAIANATATPKVLNSPNLSGGNLKEKVAVITPAADDTSTSVGRIMRLPSNARVGFLGVKAADATTAGNIDIGLYDINGGAVKDADLFASALDLALGPLVEDTNIVYEAGFVTTADAEQMLWEQLGLATDPKLEFDLAYTITTTFNGGPVAILFKVQYVQ